MLGKLTLPTLLLATFVVNAAHADRIFFSHVGPPVESDPSNVQPTFAPEPLIIGEVPGIQGRVGERHSLHVWCSIDRGSTRLRYNSVALDIESSDPAVAHATAFTWLNAWNTLPDGFRWEDQDDGMIGTIGDPSWVSDALVLQATALGIGRSYPVIPGFMPDKYLLDQGRDTTSLAFYLGRLDFEIDRVGRTGLYFRVGEFGTLTSLQPFTGASLQFGGNTVSPAYNGKVAGAGDPITTDLIFVDAIVIGVPEPATGWLVGAAACALLANRYARRFACAQ